MPGYAAEFSLLNELLTEYLQKYEPASTIEPESNESSDNLKWNVHSRNSKLYKFEGMPQHKTIRGSEIWAVNISVHLDLPPNYTIKIYSKSFDQVF